jgi:hypothetical protein
MIVARFHAARRAHAALPLVAMSLAIAASLGLTFTAAHGQDVMRVEEDWELVLAEPASIKTAPQLETVLSPFGHINSIFARTTWNYREFDDFQPGGMQLQAWNGSSYLARANFGTDDLSTVSETVSWTQVLETNGLILTLQIKNGDSMTWGAFGGTSLTLQGIVYLPNLNAYSTDVSTSESGITFGANRVAVLRIKEVRRYGAGNVLLSTDSTPKVIHQN